MALVCVCACVCCEKSGQLTHLEYPSKDMVLEREPLLNDFLLMLRAKFPGKSLQMRDVHRIVC